MSTDPRPPVTSPLVTSPVPDKPTLEGLEDKWMQRWAKERVVQV
jgi:hypothetical protein